MSPKSHSDSGVPAGAASDATEPQTATTATLRAILMDASAELAKTKGDEADWSRNYARVARWIARQVPQWRELALKTGQAPGQDTPSALEIDSVLNLINGFLTSLTERAPRALRDRERQAAIERAKQEWECTADALTALVCLLNVDGFVLRANRVVEHWGLGSVSDVIGTHAHVVLHPACSDPRCALARGLQDALPKLRRGETQEFEFYSPAKDQTLQFTLRPMLTLDDASAPPRDPRSGLGAPDVSGLAPANK